MPKNREGKRDEFYKAKIRELEKEVRSLRRHVKDLEKNQHAWEDVVIGESDIEDIVKPEKRLKCVHCGKGTVSTIELLGRLYGTCSTCGPIGKV